MKINVLLLHTKKGGKDSPKLEPSSGNQSYKGWNFI